MATIVMQSAIFSFSHTQESVSDTWVVTHNIGTLAPIVDCFVDVAGEQTKIIPSEVIATDNKTVTITFSSPQAGTAYII
jgi:hypothetical protein